MTVNHWNHTCQPFSVVSSAPQDGASNADHAIISVGLTLDEGQCLVVLPIIVGPKASGSLDVEDVFPSVTAFQAGAGGSGVLAGIGMQPDQTYVPGPSGGASDGIMLGPLFFITGNGIGDPPCVVESVRVDATASVSGGSTGSTYAYVTALMFIVEGIYLVTDTGINGGGPVFLLQSGGSPSNRWEGTLASGDLTNPTDFSQGSGSTFQTFTVVGFNGFAEAYSPKAAVFSWMAVCGTNTDVATPSEGRFSIAAELRGPVSGGATPFHALVLVSEFDSPPDAIDDVYALGDMPVDAPGVLGNDVLKFGVEEPFDPGVTLSSAANGHGKAGNWRGVIICDTSAAIDAAVKVTDPSHGTATLATDGGFVYTPGLSYPGSDSFTYKAVIPDGRFDVATVTIGGSENVSFAGVFFSSDS